MKITILNNYTIRHFFTNGENPENPMAGTVRFRNN